MASTSSSKELLRFDVSMTEFLLIIFGNRKRWNRWNRKQHFLGIARTGRVFHLFHPREWNSWKSKNSWNSSDRFGWTLDFYSGIEWFLSHLNWNRWSLEYLFQLFLILKSLNRNAAYDKSLKDYKDKHNRNNTWTKVAELADMEQGEHLYTKF